MKNTLHEIKFSLNFLSLFSGVSSSLEFIEYRSIKIQSGIQIAKKEEKNIY
jgi:hypothetical protein